MPDLAKAGLIELNTQLTDIDPSGQRVKVQFNPDTLKVSFANQIKNDQQSGKDQAQGSAGRQYVGAGTTKLALQLWFDVSAAIEPRHKVDDVRRLTQQVIYFITPRQLGNDSSRFVPPGVRFAWGSFKFDGLVDGIEETLEFFSPEGKPLRASIALTMSQQKILKAEFGPAGLPGMPGSSPLTAAAAGSNLQNMAAALGNMDWQGLAAANGIENPRLLTPGQLIDMNRKR